MTLNYQGRSEGVLLASGPGRATATIYASGTWALGDSALNAPTVQTRHSMAFGVDKSFELEDGEHLYLFTTAVIASTADNPAPGHMEDNV